MHDPEPCHVKAKDHEAGLVQDKEPCLHLQKDRNWNINRLKSSDKMSYGEFTVFILDSDLPLRMTILYNSTCDTYYIRN
jgi:hypothetical protein